MFKRKNLMNRNPVTSCKFNCLNCGFIWELSFEKGSDIVQKEEHSVEHRGKKKQNLGCPNCESSRSVVIERGYIEQRIQQPMFNHPQQYMPQQEFQYQQQVPIQQEIPNENMKKIMSKKTRKKNG